MIQVRSWLWLDVGTRSGETTYPISRPLWHLCASGCRWLRRYTHAIRPFGSIPTWKGTSSGLVARYIDSISDHLALLEHLHYHFHQGFTQQLRSSLYFFLALQWNNDYTLGNLYRRVRSICPRTLHVANDYMGAWSTISHSSHLLSHLLDIYYMPNFPIAASAVLRCLARSPCICLVCSIHLLAGSRVLVVAGWPDAEK